MSDLLNIIKFIFKLHYYNTIKIVWPGWVVVASKRNIKNKNKIKEYSDFLRPVL